MIDFVLPSLGADMDEAALVAWLVEPGDHVESGQVIAEVETDKGIIEIECWNDGVVDELVRQPGPEKLKVGALLARLSSDQEPPPSKPPVTAPTGLSGDDARPRAGLRPAPPIRHLAHTLGVDIDAVSGTGSGGSVTRRDIRQAAVEAPTDSQRSDVPMVADRVRATPRARMVAREQGVDLTTVTPSRGDGMVVHADVRMTATNTRSSEPEDRVAAMRNAITRSMSHSKREIPHYYLATRIDLGEAMTWLDLANAEVPLARRLLPAALLLKATAVALRQVPDLNGHWIDDGFVSSAQVHLGVAISLREGGLVAPAIHDADLLELAELMQRLRDLVTRARAWRIRGSELTDPTVTVTNLGDRGVDTAFPVIIPPQVAMVAFGKILEEVVVFDGRPAVRPVVHA
ncbi:MAG: dihydrolipoamide acetyltransferase family protein, partial [Acidimicrobiia bacterium]